MNHERNKAQVAFLSAMERAPAQESAPLVTLGGLTQKLLTGGALLHRGGRPSSGERALPHEGAPFSIAKGSFRNLLTGGALLHRGARPSSGERALTHEGTPFLPRGLIKNQQSQNWTLFCIKNECRSQGAGTQFVHKI
jgi:hypothetical protein